MGDNEKQLSPDKAAELSMKLSERSDQHFGKAVLFFALAVAVGVWNVELNTGTLMPIKMTAANKQTAIGLLGWVGAYHVVFAIMSAYQGIRIGQHAPQNFRELFVSPQFRWPMLLMIPILLFLLFAVAFSSIEMFEVLRSITGR